METKISTKTITLNQQMLIVLFLSKDRKRREALYTLYSQPIQLKLSLPFIADLINKDLDVVNLITKEDIKYCRHYFSGKKKILQNIFPEPIEATKIMIDPSEITWTNPDETTNSQNQFKSKYSK